MASKSDPLPPDALEPDVAYGPEYYERHCGPIPCSEASPAWREHNERVAEAIVRGLTPRRVFDAGCSEGLLVAALVDRNVDAEGRDISSYAISQVREDVRSHCSVGSIADPIPGEYDLVTCIEVLEHMPQPEARRAITSLTSAAPRILFSSTPADFDEPTHVNVHPIIYWLRLFARSGFVPVAKYDATYICPHAMLLERQSRHATEAELDAFAELVRLRMNVAASRSADASAIASERAARDQAQAELQMRLADAQATASSALRQLLEVQTLLSEYLDREAGGAKPTWLRRVLRRVLPFWLRRFILRAIRVIWWSVTLQLPRRLLRRRERLREEASAGSDQPVDVQDLIIARFSLAGPIATFRVPDGEPTISIVTESLRPSDLLGGVGTALIVGSLLAESMGARLRVVTRGERGEAARVAEMLGENGLRVPRDLELVYAPANSAESIPVGPRDAFLTTSWRASRAMLPAAESPRVIQLVENDERLWYGIGDDRLRCAETLSDPRLRLLIDGEPLLKSLGGGPDPLPELTERAQWFDPALPERLFHADDPARLTAEQRIFLFAAESRGGGPLCWRGLEALSLAIEQGLLTPEEWRVVLVGDNLTPVRLPGGVLTELAEGLTLAGYAALLRQTDLALNLAGSPNLSYSSLRLLVSGAVVVTDGQPPTGRSPDPDFANVVTSKLDVQSVEASLARGLSLVRNDAATMARRARARFAGDWSTALKMAVSRCSEWIRPQ